MSQQSQEIGEIIKKYFSQGKRLRITDCDGEIMADALIEQVCHCDQSTHVVYHPDQNLRLDWYKFVSNKQQRRLMLTKRSEETELPQSYGKEIGEIVISL